MARIGRTLQTILLLAIGFVATALGTGLVVGSFRNLLSEPYLLMITGTVNIGLTVGVIYLLQVKLARGSWAELGMSQVRTGLPGFLRGIMLGVAFTGCILLALWAIGAIRVRELLWLHHSWSWVGTTLAGGIFFYFGVGLTEELLFRGYLLRGLQRELGLTWAAPLSALLFAVAHLLHPGYFTPWIILEIFLIGLFFVMVALADGNLWRAIGFHFAWDFIGTNVAHVYAGESASESLVLFQGVGPNWLMGPAYGPSGSLVEVLATVCLCLLWAWRRYNPTTQPALTRTGADESIR